MISETGWKPQQKVSSCKTFILFPFLSAICRPDLVLRMVDPFECGAIYSLYHTFLHVILPAVVSFSYPLS